MCVVCGMGVYVCECVVCVVCMYVCCVCVIQKDPEPLPLSSLNFRNCWVSNTDPEKLKLRSVLRSFNCQFDTV